MFQIEKKSQHDASSYTMVIPMQQVIITIWLSIVIST
jgi:hypothetical protein